jgi:predicted peptidase
LFLHGGQKSSGRGAPSLPESAFYKEGHVAKHPCYILRPVALRGENWVYPRNPKLGSHALPSAPSNSNQAVLELLSYVVAQFAVDARRIHVVGASMGGYGVWDLVARHPHRFASATPICAGGDPSLAARFKHMRLWLFHCADDPAVPVRGSREMFAALAAARNEEPVFEETDLAKCYTLAHGDIRYTEYKSGGHESWVPAFNDPDWYEWVFGSSL